MGETRTAQNRRRSERVMLHISVHVLAENEQRQQIRVEAKTLVVNAHGGLMEMKDHLHVGQSFLLTNSATGSEMSCRVVRVDETGMEDFHIAFEFDRPAPKFWPVTFPPADWGLPS
jgi:PilZ domain